MNKFKKTLAIFTATVLTVMPMVAYADNSATQQTATGQGAIENDNSKAPEYDKVVLPTVSNSTFDFTLDPDMLLKEYDRETYKENATLLFHSTKTPAKIKIKDGDKTAYKQTYVAQVASSKADLSALLAVVTVAAADGAVTVDIDNTAAVRDWYYIWVPDTTEGNEGMGKYVKVDDSNFNTYFKVTTTGAAGSYAKDEVQFINPKLAASACDGSLYKLTYEALGAAEAEYDATDYVTYDASAKEVSAIADLYVSADGSAFAALAKTETTKYEYTPAVVAYNGNSDTIKIVNKSTYNMDVTATMTVKNATGLSFSTTNDFSGDGDDEKLVYLAVTNGTTPTAVATVGSDGNAKIEGTYSLAAPTAKPLKYQTTAKDPKTGSHIYKQYMPASLTYNEVTLKVTGAANAGAGSTAWNKYADALRAYEKPEGSDVENIIPTLEVVFKIDKHVDRYVTQTTVSTSSNALTLNLPAGVTMTKVQSVKESTVTDLTTQWYTLSDTTLTINNTILNNTANLKIRVTFSDNHTEDVTIQR